jgi:hypothetical protein
MTMSRLQKMLCAVVLTILSGCEFIPNTKPVSLSSTEATRVAGAIARWPMVKPGEEPIRRTFFTTLHWGGQRVTAQGVMNYYGPRDFRMTAVTELGVILFDGRINWGGVTVLRSFPGLDKGVVESLIRDISRGLELPESLAGLAGNTQALYLRKTLSDTHRHTWTFDLGTGVLRSTEVKLGMTDTLYVDYKAYDSRGWPEEVAVRRQARGLTAEFTFTDNTVVKQDGGGNAQ